MASQKARPAWQDRFRAPNESQLVEPLNKQLCGAFEHARARLRGDGAFHEAISWQGVWNWTFVYTNGEPDKPMAYLVPDPIRPRLAVPVPDDIVPTLPIKKLSKFVRDGLAHAPVVSNLRWAQWDIQSKAQVDEILTLIESRSAPAAPTA